MKTLNRKKSIGLCCLFVMGAFVLIPALGQDDEGSVYDYAINWAVQTGPTEITVEAQARYCGGCNPNSGGASGCTAFEHSLPPYGMRSCTKGRPNGTYIAVRIKDVTTNAVLAMQKLVLQSGVNLTLNTICTWQFVFSGLSVSAGQQVKVEADTYCSYCYHWYPNPVTLTVQGSNSQVTYGGDTSALVGTSANVSATLVDAGTNAPLAGRTITFTLNPPAPIATVSAVTNASGVAATTMLIPAATAAGTYTMDTRFAGDASYFPCSDQELFTVIVEIAVDVDIKPGSFPNSINPKGKGVIPVAILGTPEFDVATVNGTTVVFAGASPAHDLSDPAVVADHLHDVDLDGYIDYIFHFRVQETNIAPGDTSATLTGQTTGGIPISGTDSVRTVGKN